MKVLVIAEGISYPGIEMSGMRAVYDLQKNLFKLGVDVHILTSAYSWSDTSWFRKEERKEGIHFYYISVKPWDKLPLFGFLVSKIFFLFQAFQLKGKKFDIVHIYSSAPFLFRLSGIYRKILRAKVIHTLSTYNTSFLGSFRWAGGGEAIEQVICVTQHMKKEIAKRKGFADKLIYLPFGFDRSRLTPRSIPAHLKKRLNISEEKKIVLFLGPLEKRKGAFTLARAAPLVIKRYPDTIFLFASYGKEGLDRHHQRHREELLKIVKEQRESLRILEGMQDVSSLLEISNIFVLPQDSPHGVIGYPLTLLEAMAAGKAIVASDTWGVNELIRDGENGLLFPPNNSQDLSSSLERLLKEETLREKLGEKAKEEAGRYYLESTAQNLVRIYREVLKRE